MIFSTSESPKSFEFLLGNSGDFAALFFCWVSGFNSLRLQNQETFGASWAVSVVFSRQASLYLFCHSVPCSLPKDHLLIQKVSLPVLYLSSAWFCPSTFFLQCLDSFLYSFASVLPCNSTFSYWMAWILLSLLQHLSKAYQSVLQHTIPLYQTEKQKTFCYKFLNSQPALVYIKSHSLRKIFYLGGQAYQIAIFSYLMLKTCMNPYSSFHKFPICFYYLVAYTNLTILIGVILYVTTLYISAF